MHVTTPHTGQIGKITQIYYIVLLQAQEVAPGGRGALGIKNRPPGGSGHWGVVGGVRFRAQTGDIFRAVLAKSVNELAKSSC
jgi:hypothetical protein